MIQVENLTKYYGLKPAIQNISLDIESGKIVGLLGPNGAGKTTILRILTCFMQPTSGRVAVDGLDCRTRSLEVRKRIGFLPETVPLYSDLRVQAFLRFAASIKGLIGGGLRRELDRVISECGLQEHRKRLIKHLSKGLKQRVGLAQALLNDPPLLILDEPTTGLDPAQIIEVRNLIRDLGGERNVLLSTHILPEVSQLCDKVIILHNGRVLKEDTPLNLAREIQQGFRTVISVDGPEDEVLRALSGLQGVIDVRASGRPGEIVVNSSSDEGVRPLMARTIVESGWGLREMRSSELSLEEVFVHLVTEETGQEGENAS
ncbi:MAG: ABC transporter ATP-binding protein [Thermodesulfobacteriota bacterium]